MITYCLFEENSDAPSYTEATVVAGKQRESIIHYPPWQRQNMKNSLENRLTAWTHLILKNTRRAWQEMRQKKAITVKFFQVFVSDMKTYRLRGRKDYDQNFLFEGKGKEPKISSAWSISNIQRNDSSLIMAQVEKSSAVNHTVEAKN